MLSAFLLALASCSGAASATSVALEITPGYSAASGANGTAGFDEAGSFVLRCASFAENEQGITIATSKSKSLKANVLVFIKLPETAGPEADVPLAAAPITGKEYEYDMAQAMFYTVTYSSAEAAVRDYGIPYLDWQTGACNSSEKFPCCE